MKTQDLPGTDRETLSALHDGELQGDARRFAARRLAHDTAWQDDCGRWQLIGDAMRRQAPIAAPADFASRVTRALAAEAVGATSIAAPSAPMRRPARLWVGGAIAASLALLAVFAARGPSPAPAAASPVVAVAPSAPAAAPVDVAAAPAPASAPTTAAPAADAAVVTPRLPVERIAAANAAPRDAARSARRTEAASPAPRIAGPAASGVVASAFVPPDATNPFHVRAADPLASRPWPRAALSSTAALTASYGAQGEGRGESPTFYPFEPGHAATTQSDAEAP